MLEKIGLDVQSVKNYCRYIRTDKYYASIRNKIKVKGQDFEYFVLLLYALCRETKPDVVVETGVASGRSSAFILKALEDNGKGHLYSIDLPNYDLINLREYPDEYHVGRVKGIQRTSVLPKDEETGWVVPSELRHRWTLLLENTSSALPNLLNKLKDVDIFFHDSDHTYQNMMFEFQTVYPFIKKDGLILSDNVNWNNSFDDFIRTINHVSLKVFRSTIGILRKGYINT